MYIASKLSTEQIVHEENCRYAVHIKARNRILYYTAEDAYDDGKCACTKCCTVMKKIYEEINELQDFCKNNGISLIFSASDGTLDIETPSSSWKLAAAKGSRCFYLYHRNTVDFDDGSSPYAGYHFQRIYYSTIIKHLRYIVSHDQYKKEQAERIRIMRHNELLYFHPVADTIRPRRRIEKIKSTKKHFTAREHVRYACSI